LAPAAYIERLENGTGQAFPFSPAVVQSTRVMPKDEMGETMMLGMRLVGEGVREADFKARFGRGLGDQYGRSLRHLRRLGLIEWDDGGARLTSGGRLLGNRVFREFV
jgi:oxygen-independent coproporphyrinogen-3 oxidase